MIEDNIVDKFWSRVNRTDDPTQCWLWTGGQTRGYGQLRVFYDRVLAHRYAYEVTHGDIPEGLKVCHKCDVPLCCNPNHLFVGTYTDNNRDRESKGRGKRGKGKGTMLTRSRQNNSKVTLEQRSQIKELYSTGAYNYQELADQFHVSRATISRWVAN